MKRTMFVLVAGLLLSSGLCAAQTRPVQKAKAENKVQYEKVTRFEFDNDVVDGEIQRPDGETVDGLRKGRLPSLIRVRLNFVPEMLKTVEGL